MEGFNLKFNFQKWVDSYIGLDINRMYALYLSCRGLEQKQIALVLHRSTKTISRWLKQACKVLGASNKTEAYYIAGKQGLWDDFDPFDKELLTKVANNR